MDDLVLARAIHVIAVLFWIGGVGFVTWVVMPALRASERPADRLARFHQIDGHFAWQARVWVGVYGMLGLGLTLYCMRGLTDVTTWNQRSIKIAFWSLNVGIAMMTFLSLLPQGILQTYASVEHGYASARSAEFIHSPIMQALVWARVPGDVVFSVGVFAFAWFMFRAFAPGNRQSRT